MSGNRAKKVRQEARAAFARQGITGDAVEARVAQRVEERAAAEFEARIKKSEAVLAKIAGVKARAELVRPKPKWWPVWLWKRVVKLVVST
jgi:hypothetical protein